MHICSIHSFLLPSKIAQQKFIYFSCSLGLIYSNIIIIILRMTDTLHHFDESPTNFNYKDKQQAINHIGSIVQQSQLGIQKQDQFKIHKPHLIKGALIGTAVTALIRWNMGKYSRFGIFRKRWALVRHIIKTNTKPNTPAVFTNYYSPNLDTAAKNFMCYSGEAGIGKSSHFINLAYTQSGARPALYLSFKFTGKDQFTFEQDISQQAQYGENSPGILSEIIKAIKIIDRINKYPQRFWFKVLLKHIAFISVTYGIAISSIDATYGMIMFGCLATSYIAYLGFIYPLLIQSFRRTCPVLIFDDLNKIQQLNMFHQVVRYLQVLDQGMANVILISPDQDTWCRLRREPGVKDRLRVRQIFYNHIYTAESILKYISDDKNFDKYMKYINGNRLYKKDIVISLVKELIGKRQVTLRRFTSLLILNDEQDYEQLVDVLKQSADGKLSNGETVQRLTDIIYQSQAKTMVANLKSIKRQLKLGDQQYLKELKQLLKKKKLPSDNTIAPLLKAYSIVRDMQSEYIFNGRFMFTVFNIAIQQFEKDLKSYKSKQALNTPFQAQNEMSQDKNAGNIKNWNNTNVAPQEIKVPEPERLERGNRAERGQRIDRPIQIDRNPIRSFPHDSST